MGEVLVQGGKAYLTHPWTGEVQAVDPDQVMGLLAGGMSPASPEQYQDAWKREHFGGAAGAATTAAVGAARGATFGLSDLALRGAGVSAGSLRSLEEANPTAGVLGEIGGTVAGSFIPMGPLAQVGRAGAAAGAGARATAARVLGRSAESAIPRLAGSVAREGTFGAALGAGHGLTQSALNDEELGGLEILTSMAKGAAGGAAFGMGLGALGSVAVTGGKKVAARWQRGTGELKQLRTEQSALVAERESMASSGAAPAQLERVDRQIVAVTTAVKEQQVKVAGQVFAKSVGMGIGAAIGGGPGGGALGYLLAPMAAKALKRALSPLGGRVGNLGERLKERIVPWAERIGEAAEWTTAAAERGGGRRVFGEGAGRIAGAFAKARPEGAGRVGGIIGNIRSEAEAIADRMAPGSAEGFWGSYMGRSSTGKRVGQRAASFIDDVTSRTQRGIEGFADDAGAVLGRAGERWAASPAGQRIRQGYEAAAGRIAEPVGAAAGRAGRWVQERLPGPETTMGQAAIEIAGHAVGAAAAAAPEKMVAGFMAGGLEGAAIAAGYHAAKEQGGEIAINRLTAALTAKVFPAARKAAFDVIAPGNAAAVVEEIHQLDTGPELQALLQAQFPINTPAPLQQAISDQLSRAIGYLQSTTRPPEQNAIPTTERAPKQPDKEARATLARLEAVLSPQAVLERFGDGELRKEHVEALGAVYPPALQQLQAVVRSEVERVKAGGGHYDRNRAQQIALVLGEPGPRIAAPRTVAMLQGLHAEGQDEQGGKGAGKPTRRTGIRAADQRETTMQRIRGGRYARR